MNIFATVAIPCSIRKYPAGFSKSPGIRLPRDRVRCAADGDNQIVILHDETIDRLANGKGYIKDFTYEELTNSTSAAHGREPGISPAAPPG